MAVYYDEDTSSITPTAKGGLRSSGSHQHGGAGTVFLDDKDDAQANGTLRIGNDNQSNDSATTQTSGSSETYDVIDIRDGAEYVVPSGATLSTVVRNT